MEILQTIWTTLTTPNESFTQLFISPLILIELTVAMLLFITILNITANSKQKILYLIILSVWSVISRKYFPELINVFTNLLIWPLVIMLIFKVSFFKGLLAEIFPLCCISLFESLFIKIYSLLTNLEYSQLYNTPIHRFIYLLCVYLIIYLLYCLAKHFRFNITLLDNMNKRNKYTLLLNSIFGIITLFTQLYIANFYSNLLPLPIIIISLITVIVYFVISLYSLTRTTQLQLTEENLEEAQLYNKSLKILHDNVRGFKHDFSNIVQAIGGYVTTNDMQGLEQYYSELLEDLQRVNNLATLSPEVINNPAIYSILASKYHKADELGIDINLEVFLDLNSLHMKIYEFTRILGILMDNAIEATNECDEKIINVELRKDFKVNRQILLIENTYKEKNIDIDKIFQKGYSSKPKNTGLGLWEVRQILKKNNNLNLYTTKNDKFFIQQFEIYEK